MICLTGIAATAVSLGFFLSAGLSASDKYLNIYSNVDTRDKSRKGKKGKKKKRRKGKESDSEEDLPAMHAVSTVEEMPEVLTHSERFDNLEMVDDSDEAVKDV